MIWDEDRNLGKGYNDAINQHPDEDWVAVIDHDAMFTTMDWYTQLQDVLILILMLLHLQVEQIELPA